MSRVANRKSILSLLVAFTLIGAFAVSFVVRSHSAQAVGPNKIIGAGNNHPICSRLGKSLQASQGAQIFCFGPQSNGTVIKSISNPSFGSNVDAANPREDRSPSGVQSYGQSETSVAASGSYVVEAWNDATGFFSPCSASMNKAELTGFGFSNNGGKSFVDLGGLPNSNCNTSRTEGDPSVEAYTVGGHTYFYISSIFIPFTVPQNDLSITVCVVVGSGSSAALSCSDPVVAATSGQCVDSGGGNIVCSFLDKEFLSIDPVRARLYMSYTDFGVNFSTPDNFTNGQIELAVCDLSSPATPTCYNGSKGTGTGIGTAPYLVVAPGDLSCEREGAYPAVDVHTGAVYVAHEFNWATNLFGSGGPTDCRAVPTKNQLDYIPFSCLTIPVASCLGPTATKSVKVISMDAAFIPGYNRFPASDFPRIAVSDHSGTVSIVWNDARNHVLGDILLQSYALGSLTRIQASPVRINPDTGGMHFLPALRNADEDGRLNVSWYSRSNPNSTITNVSRVNVSALTSGPASGSALVTTGPSDWNAVSSDIVPNFGDYTDNYVANGETLYVAWSDGRLGDPQPFEQPIGDPDLGIAGVP